LALSFGLGQSFFERLSLLTLYRRHALGGEGREEKAEKEGKDGYKDFGYYNPLFVTKLLNNYRSHPAILTLPSRLFYENELVASADQTMREAFCNWEVLPNQDQFPIILHGVIGVDIQEGTSPSWFNPTEAILVYDYIEKLSKYKISGFDLNQVGVISPFRKQVEKIRTLLRGRSRGKVKVGSVEDFQGQERKVIIVSLVRSSSQFLEQDQKHGIGFLGNAKRFNVVVTRAQCLLIVIGNPFLLLEDEWWSQWLKYCIGEKCYCGCPPPQIEEDVAKLKEEEEHWRYKNTLSREDPEDEDDELEEEERPSKISMHELPEWRND
jgi:hypothetical protein